MSNYTFIANSDVASITIGQFTCEARPDKTSTDALLRYEGDVPASLSGITIVSKDGRTVHTADQAVSVIGVDSVTWNGADD